VQDIIDQMAAMIREAAKQQRPLRIRGGGTKDFYGGEIRGDILDTSGHRGIVEYEPTELAALRLPALTPSPSPGRGRGERCAGIARK